MTVDVLFPYYGDVALMKQAVASVLGQSDPDLRLVVVDDGYPDPEVEPWFRALDDPRVEYHRNPENLGANGNYRKALTYVRNELVVVMGADDIMLPNYTAWLKAQAASCPEAAVFQPGVVVIDERGAVSAGLIDQAKGWLRPAGQGVRLGRGEAVAASLLRGNWFYFPALGWRAEAITAVGFRQGYDIVQDLILVLDIVRRGGAFLLDDTLAFCSRRHSGSDSSQRALSGTRFTEESQAFRRLADAMDAIGWHHAARVARRHVFSRLNAATLLPRAALKGQWAGVGTLARHVLQP